MERVQGFRTIDLLSHKEKNNKLDVLIVHKLPDQTSYIILQLN